jgi:hypothetical protein
MEPGSLPHWAQAIFYIILAVGGASTGLFGYFKKKAKEEETEVAKGGASAAVISASFIDSKLLRELIEALRELQDEQGRDAKKLHRLLQDVREAMNELNEATIVQTDTTMNLVRFINRDAHKARVLEEKD